MYSGDSDADMDDHHHDDDNNDDEDRPDDDSDGDEPGKKSSSKGAESSEAKFDDIAEGLKELDMEHYDDEDDDGIFCFG